ncbi:cytochrome P450 [Mycolicibacterium moriokaense]|nr:cytochrome P450 [Mycolicibacterium moriokaense]
MARDASRFISGDGVLIPENSLPRVPALEYDGAEHKRWRDLMNELLGLTETRRHEPMVMEVVDRQIDTFAARGSADLAKEYAHPIPAVVIGRLIGLDADLSLQGLRYSERAFGAIGHDDAVSAMAAFAEFIVAQLNERRRHPTDDFLTRLATGHYHNLVNDDFSAVQIVAAFIGGGQHSTASGISSLICRVLSDPDITARVKTDPEALRRAVEETLRIMTPLQLFARTATNDTDIDGTVVPRGARCLLNYAAANRDPEVFVEPTVFNIDRQPNRHLAFGKGIHVCVGQHLARLEMSIALIRLLERFPDIELIGEPAKSSLLSANLMRYETLHSRFTPMGV